ncbi:DUF4345 domain-containing protein [Spirosoma endbachense]|uniref:DUF4345 domain-containing protein n=1 Tax=Spirosoma endbachense TaxID=2666025 RepID=A0A6P1W6J5_9BACT|nr:DUF4345 domain-containing protein [Spirosoma endbachense]QHW00954.1 DUF4345 domain-containing protein [Spirosoma endbachense]
MKKQAILKRLSQGYILLSAVALLSVSIMAFSSPQSVMNLVHVQLNNTDAFSSIRGVYGGVGLTLFISLIYLMINDIRKGLAFLSLLWGFYALSRMVTIFTEGSLGDFGTQWLITESVLFVIALILYLTNPQSAKANVKLQSV